MKSSPSVTPRLVVESASDALEFYCTVFAATELERYVDGNGNVVHSAIQIGTSIVAVVDGSPTGPNRPPSKSGATGMILQVDIQDPDGAWGRAVERGAEVIFPLDDQSYGRREGRLRDPFGHVWMIGTEIESLSKAEIQRRIE